MTRLLVAFLLVLGACTRPAEPPAAVAPSRRESIETQWGSASALQRQLESHLDSRELKDGAAELQFVHARQLPRYRKHRAGLVQALAEAFGMPIWDAKRPWLRRVRWFVRQNDDATDKLATLEDPDIRFYLAQTRRYLEGIGLLLVAPISLANIVGSAFKPLYYSRRAIARRLFPGAPATPMLHPPATTRRAVPGVVDRESEPLATQN